MTFTKEQLIARARFLIKRQQDSLANHPDQDGVAMDLELARMAMAGMEAEPVAWKVAFKLEGQPGSNFDKIFESRQAMNDVVSLHERGGFIVSVTPLYAAPQPLTTSERAELENYRNAQQVVPDVLPCPVKLEPGMRFGKGIRTEVLLGALQRRAKHMLELDAMTPEQRAEHDAGVEEFKAMLSQAGHKVEGSDDGRDQFEEWFKFHHGDEHSIVTLHRANGGLNYRDPHVDLAWIAWKDSRAAMLSGAVKDGWVACSERMPDEIAVSGTMDFGEQCYADGWNKCRMEMLNKKVINQQSNKKTIAVNYLIDEIDKQSSKYSR